MLFSYTYYVTKKYSTVSIMTMQSLKIVCHIINNLMFYHLKSTENHKTIFEICNKKKRKIFYHNTNEYCVINGVNNICGNFIIKFLYLFKFY